MKRTYDCDAIDLRMNEVCESLENIQSKLNRLESIVDDLYLKASMSNCLLLIRKIAEDKKDELNKLLD